MEAEKQAANASAHEQGKFLYKQTILEIRSKHS